MCTRNIYDMYVCTFLRYDEYLEYEWHVCIQGIMNVWHVCFQVHVKRYMMYVYSMYVHMMNNRILWHHEVCSLRISYLVRYEIPVSVKKLVMNMKQYFKYEIR